MTRSEEIARLIAFWHGQKIVMSGARRGGALTVAAIHGFNSGSSWETDRYVDAHWQEYLPSAKAVLRYFEPDYVG